MADLVNMTGMDLLMKVAERIRTHGEVEDILIVYTDEGRAARLSANCNYTRALGLARWADDEIRYSMRGFDGGEGEDKSDG